MKAGCVKMTRYSVHRFGLNTFALIVLFTVFWILVSIDNTEDDNSLHPRLRQSRQLKTIYNSVDNVFQQSTQNSTYQEIKKGIPIIYAITPTYYRVTQQADLTRMANTLRQVKRLHWIVVEDWSFTNHYVYELLKFSNISFTYLAQRTRKTTTTLSKGIDQRNEALSWIEQNHDWSETGVVYFADDDNSYDLRIFEEMRYTKKLSMWPVGLSANWKVERPIVVQGKVKSFHAWWSQHRTFPIDMAGFAVNVNVLWDYYPMRFKTNPRYCCMLETSFLELCCTVQDIEPLAKNCTKVYVWHTRTSKPDLSRYKPSYGEPYV